MFLFLVAGIQNVDAQKEMKQGTITIGITDLKMDDPSVAPYIGMVKTATLNLQFDNEKALATADVMGGMMKLRVLMQSNPKDMLMLIDAMGEKMMTKMNADELKKIEDMGKEEKTEEIDYDVVYDKSITKEILGYKCHQASIIIKDPKAAEMNLKITAFVTKEITYPKSLTEGYEEAMKANKLKDMPLEITISGGEGDKVGSITLAATKIDKTTVDETVFKLNTEGYKSMEMDELKDMGKKM